MKARVLFLLALSALSLAACQRAQEPGASATPTEKTSASTAPTSAMARVLATDAWSRATPPGAPVAGGYVSLQNQSTVPDRLVAIASPASAQVEIHEMNMDNGVMKMRRLDEGLALPPGEKVVLGPGSIHLMFIAPHAPFEVGKPVTATLI
ncbi:copper chaperone PCu(A)C [Xanthomonas populi]|uniref:copper chaperone PCu(A)C n=1 Tax=Xanthomonas populi TaxID=53414 RepID=UPI001FC998D4|nr:copper chaperone PCu(A)C [Xanthomonas populi]